MRFDRIPVFLLKRRAANFATEQLLSQSVTFGLHAEILSTHVSHYKRLNSTLPIGLGTRYYDKRFVCVPLANRSLPSLAMHSNPAPMFTRQCSQAMSWERFLIGNHAEKIPRPPTVLTQILSGRMCVCVYPSVVRLQ